VVITNSIPTLAKVDADFDLLAHVHKVLGNPARLKVLSALESTSLSFTELMKPLGLNPKTLSSALNLMAKSGLIRKSYPYQVYVITPLGRRILRDQVHALRESLQPTVGLERGGS
jgi:DNA-binding HxlR family transcriptional regulator